MMVGDNLGETQLQQLVDRQLARATQGIGKGGLAALISDEVQGLSVVPDFLFVGY